MVRPLQGVGRAQGVEPGRVGQGGDCRGAQRTAACHRCHHLEPPRPSASPAVLSDTVPLVLSRQLLLAFAQSLQQLAPDVQQGVAA